MKHYILTLRQLSTGYVRQRKVYWNTDQFKHYSNRLNTEIAGMEIIRIEALDE